MLSIPQRVTGISHPLVREVYLKKECRTNQQDKSVLIIEARESELEQDHELFDSYLVELLGDLEELKKAVQNKIGVFDRIDIRTH